MVTRESSRPGGAEQRLKELGIKLPAPPEPLVIWRKYDPSSDLGEPERYRKDVPKAQVHVLDAGHFALDTAADQIAGLVRDFLGSSR